MHGAVVYSGSSQSYEMRHSDSHHPRLASIAAKRDYDSDPSDPSTNKSVKRGYDSVPSDIT